MCVAVERMSSYSKARCIETRFSSVTLRIGGAVDVDRTGPRVWNGVRFLLNPPLLTDGEHTTRVGVDMLATHWRRTSMMVAATVFAVAACSKGDDADDTDTGAVTTSGGDVASSPSPAIVMGFLTPSTGARSRPVSSSRRRRPTPGSGNTRR